LEAVAVSAIKGKPLGIRERNSLKEEYHFLNATLPTFPVSPLHKENK